jgi:hypothetical protein
VFWREFFDKSGQEEMEMEGEKIRRFVSKRDANCSGYIFPMSFNEGRRSITFFPAFFNTSTIVLFIINDFRIFPSLTASYRSFKSLFNVSLSWR